MEQVTGTIVSESHQKAVERGVHQGSGAPAGTRFK